MDNSPRNPDTDLTKGREKLWQKVLRTLGITLGALLILLLIGYAFEVLLLIFAAVLIAVFFRGTAEVVSRSTGLSSGWSLTFVLAGILTLMALTTWLLASRISEQVVLLSEEFPRAVAHFRDRFGHTEWGNRLSEETPTVSGILANEEGWLKRSLGVLSTTLGVIADIYIILFLTIFITAQPFVYRKGIVLLFPLAKRSRAEEVLDTLGDTLYKWLLGKLFSMLVVGIFTTIGLSLLGIPLELVLGLIAGLLSFIPNFGPILGLVPAVMVALLEGPYQALYVIMLYVGIQIVESNLITPLVQRRMIAIPPALIIIAQLLLGIFSGTLGLILATPVIAVVMVLVKMLYIHDTLGDTSIMED
ncbi:putative PurR-regulated permease PerM [Pontibacter ummariensis]|uniref:Predicted PurR-regulated permease PerM n=1 Tax=Pontibacter ummariensis TaxID=1610492 RepID=A0A239LFN0_9BACT|nr:AI-2E family transporter [Pontibacter ummariensis]PRY03635.1 putative PurR-regulated permease PerM [Pontibacter ummariensis]SNT28752.1 Predicted PurR-regulated permease PerM [Pontibacter ummariensis]